MENKVQIKNSTNKDSSDENTITLKEKMIYISIIIIIILLFLFIFFFIEFVVHKIIIRFTFTKFISIPIQIFLHILLIRYLILQIIFVGANKYLSRDSIINYGLNIANYMDNSFTSFLGILLLLNDGSNLLSLNFNKFKEIKEQFENIKKIIIKQIDLFNKIKNKFNVLTKDQQIFYDNINNLNRIINENDLLNWINKIIKELKKNNIDLISDLSEDKKNEISSEFQKNEQNIKKLLFLSKEIIGQIKDYIGKDSKSELRNIRNYLQNNLFSSIEQFHCELSNFFKYEEKYFITKDKIKIEYIIIKNNSIYKSKKLMIICGPNGVPFQILSRNNTLNHYLDSNIDILFWNYRGYGFSQGTPSFNNLRTDILELFDEIQKLNQYEQYGIHGISIGGIPCCHLARHRKEIQLMVCDRNFGKLDYFIQNYSNGKILYQIYKLLLFQSSDNVDNYLNSNCYRIILNDPRDKIVYDNCSLKTLISAELCKKYFESNFCDNSENIKNEIFLIHNELETLKNSNSLSDSQNIEINNININASDLKNNNKSNTEKITSLDKIFNSVNEKNNFINLLINISNLLNNNLQENQEQENNYIINKDLINKVKDNLECIFNNIASAGDTLSSLFELKYNYIKAIFIDNFFNNLFIWGSNSEYNYPENNTKNIENTLNKFTELLKNFLNSNEIELYKDNILIKEIQSLYKYFIVIQNNIKYVGLNLKNNFVKLIDENNSNEYENSLIELNRGNLVNLTCGHNGILFYEEMEIFQKYLKKSKFFSYNNKNNEIDNENSVEDEIYE